MTCLSTHVYDHLTKEMATSINGMFDSRAIKPVHWRKEIERLDLSVRLYARRLASLADRVENGAPAARAEFEGGSAADKQIEQIIGLIRERATVLRSIQELAAEARPTEP